MLVPLPLRDTLLTLAASELYVPKWAERSMDSMERVLVDDLGRTREQARRARQAMSAAFEDAEIPSARIGELEPVMRNEPEDRYVLAAAVVSNAAKIVTLNVRHFASEACEPHGVEAITPDEFLCDLLLHSRSAVVDGLHRQALRLTRPTLPVGELLVRLAVSAPEFSERSRDLV